MKFNYKHLFWFFGFFIIGIFAASVFNFFLYKYLVFILASALAALLIILFGKYRYLILIAGLIIGSMYYFAYDAWLARKFFQGGGDFSGNIVIQKVDIFSSYQKIVAVDLPKKRYRIELKVPLHPEYLPGDVLSVAGKFSSIDGERKESYLKERISGVMSYPKIQPISERRFTLRRILFLIKKKILSQYEMVLPRQSAVFLGGLNFGEDERFDRDLREKMRATGTLHLTALSGYNITLIVSFLIFLLAGFVSLPIQLALIVLFLVLFVIMTGAEASVVRSAIMASVLLFSNYSFRNFKVQLALLLAAFLMLLLNPKILVWDVGFQLSFLSLLGLLYINPILKEKFGFMGNNKDSGGLIHWRENIATTISAQLAVFPILLYHFKSFSLLAIFTNAIILSFIPLTMFLGFLLNLFSFLSYWPAFALAQIVNMLLSLELRIIDEFSKIPLQISFQSVSVIFIVLYYAVLGWFIFQWRKRKNLIQKI